MSIPNYTVFTFIGMNVIALIVTTALAYVLCGNVAGTQLSLSLSAAYLIALSIYLNSSTKLWLGAYTLLYAFVIMGIGVVANVYEYTAEMGGTLTNPVLVNDDAFRYYDQACEIFHDQPASRPYIMPALPLVTVALWSIFGKSIVFPLAFNVFLTLLAIILTGKLSTIILNGHIGNLSASKISAIAMVLIALVCNFIGNGSLMLKEPILYVSTLLVAIPVAKFYRGNRFSWHTFASFVIGNAIIAITRTHLFYFIILALLIFSMLHIRNSWKQVLVMAIVATICYVAGTKATRYPIQNHHLIMAGGTDMKPYYLENGDERYASYTNLIGNYYGTSPVHRIVLLPVTATVQFIVPFPWNLSRDIPFGYSQIYNHIAYPWYAVGGIILFYFLFLWWKHGIPLKLWASWTAICWLVIAYLYAGTVSRYTLPFIPMMIPLAVFVISHLLQGLYIKTFFWWYVCYTIAIASGLIICHHIQQGC